MAQPRAPFKRTGKQNLSEQIQPALHLERDRDHELRHSWARSCTQPIPINEVEIEYTAVFPSSKLPSVGGTDSHDTGK